MNLVRAIPIAKGISSDVLTYYTAQDLSPGSVIDIPVRSKSVPGLILEVESLEGNKGSIKSSSFSLRKLEPTTPAQLLSPAFVKAVAEVSSHHAASVGATLAALTPKALYEQRAELSPITESNAQGIAASKGETLVLQADDETRFGHYKGLIREAFAQKHSVFIAVPTVSEGERLFAYLERGIPSYAHFVHGGIKPSEFARIWNEIAGSSQHLVVVGTATFLCLPRLWHTVVIERESSRRYKMQSRPFVDQRTFAESYARETGAACILGDELLRLETLKRLEDYTLRELSPVKWRSTSSAAAELVDMKKYNREKKEFRIISDELYSQLARNKSESGHAFVYVARRGSASSTVCRDCGTTVTCERCSAPMTLHGTQFLCHSCGERRDADLLCRVCGGWNLVPLGLGIEKVEEELRRLFPDMAVMRLDSDTASTPKQVKKIMAQFHATPGSVLIGTDLGLFALDEPVEYTAIATQDSLFSLPDFRIHEKIFHTILRLRSLATASFVAQTRHIEVPLWQEALQGNLREFYRREAKEREALRYPPFAMLVKITHTGAQDEVRAEMRHLRELLAPLPLSIFPAFIETKRGAFMMHALLRLEPGTWPDQELLGKLRSLPPSYAVDVDPEHLL